MAIIGDNPIAAQKQLNCNAITTPSYSRVKETLHPLVVWNPWRDLSVLELYSKQKSKISRS